MTILNNQRKRERRRFLRVKAPVYYRYPKIAEKRKQVSNVSLAGVRICSDNCLFVNQRLELLFFLPSGFSIEALARVVWTKELPPGAEAIYDVGLEFIHLPEKALKKLQAVLTYQS